MDYTLFIAAAVFLVLLIIIVVGAVHGIGLSFIFFVLSVLFFLLFAYLPRAMLTLEILLSLTATLLLINYFAQIREKGLVIEYLFLIFFLLAVIVINHKRQSR